MLDRGLLKLLKEGGEPLVIDGQVQFDPKGRVVRKPIPAAYWKVISMRLRDLGVNDVTRAELALVSLKQAIRAQERKLASLTPPPGVPTLIVRTG